jgi:hypothetical protein
MFALIAAETNDEKLYSKKDDKEQFNNPAICRLLLSKVPVQAKTKSMS